MDKNPVLMSSLSKDSDIPLYSQLVGIVKRNIKAGTLSPGARLPSESELCKAFYISRSTVRQAVGALEAEGLVVRKQGRGTFVSEPGMRREQESAYSFHTGLGEMGLGESSLLLEFAVVEPPPEAVKALELEDGQISVYRLRTLRNLAQEPLLLETSFYPQFVYPELTAEKLQNGSVYPLLREMGFSPARAMDSYQVVTPSDDDARLLHCPEGGSVLYAQRRSYNGNGICYEYTQSLMRADRVRLHVTLLKDGASFSRSVDQKD